MVLEAMMLVLDNSEPARNGDFFPNRMEAQKDAAILLSNSKLRANGENAIGLMTMGGSPEVLVSPTQNIDKITVSLHKVAIKGKINMNVGAQIAQLALKHRQNKNHRQRIVIFVGSPLEDEEKPLHKLAKRLKKNNVAVDIINFGEIELNTKKLQKFIGAVNTNENSHLITADTPGTSLTDLIASSSVFFDSSAPGIYSTDNGFEFGVDPNLDPELALALRLSIEEARARQEVENQHQEAGADGSGTETQEQSVHQDGTSGDNATVNEMLISNDADSDEQIRGAIALSLQGHTAQHDTTNNDSEMDTVEAPNNQPKDS